MTDYSFITYEMFAQGLEHIVSEMSPSEILHLPGVYEVVCEELSNQVLDYLVAQKRIKEEKKEEEDNTWFRMDYKCPECACEWQDEWSSIVDDECPNCHMRNIAPWAYTEITEE